MADKRIVLVVGLVVVALAVPYALMGPGFFREDWQALRNARVLGSWNAAAHGADGSRPLAGPVYALVFGALGHWPLAVYALLTAVNVVVAVLVFLVGRLFVELLRVDPAKHIAGVRFNAWVAGLGIVAGLTWFWLSQRSARPPRPNAGGTRPAMAVPRSRVRRGK